MQKGDINVPEEVPPKGEREDRADCRRIGSGNGILHALGAVLQIFILFDSSPGSSCLLRVFHEEESA
jgi:hypothetical protein